VRCDITVTNKILARETPPIAAFSVLMPATDADLDPKQPMRSGDLVRFGDGDVVVQSSEKPNEKSFFPVKRYVFDAKCVSNKFTALALMQAMVRRNPSGERKTDDYPEVASRILELEGFSPNELTQMRFTQQLEANPDGILSWNLPAVFNKETERTRFVLWWPHDAEPQPAIYCADSETASIVFLLQDQVRACVACGALFVPTRSKQEYCNLRCNARARKARSRTAKKEATQ